MTDLICWLTDWFAGGGVGVVVVVAFSPLAGFGGKVDDSFHACAFYFLGRDQLTHTSSTF